MVADYSPSRPGPYAGRMRSSHRSRWRWGIPVLVAAVALVGIGAASAGSTTQPLRADGITRGDDGEVVDVPVGSGVRTCPAPVLATDDTLPPVEAALVDADRAWLADGRVPGTGTAYEAMAERALLDLHLMIRPNGALIAANRYHWRYVWPRDLSFAVVTLSATGHHAGGANPALPRRRGTGQRALARPLPARRLR